MAKVKMSSNNITNLIGEHNSSFDNSRRNFVKGLAALVASIPSGYAWTASAEELPYKGPITTYDGITLPDLNGKEFFLVPGARVRTHKAEFKVVELNADGIKIITTSGTSFHDKGDKVLEAKISYNPKTNRYDLNGKYFVVDGRRPGETSKVLKYSGIWTDNSGKSVIDIGFGSGNEEVNFQIKEK